MGPIKIDPLTEGARPLWSVMIPAYEGAEYLAKTIRSVLVQDPGPEMMQIEVVDDYSRKEDLRAVVEQLGQGRVVYFRQPQNVGAVGNFNTCIQRSRGKWLHILHADDTVLPDFYGKLHAATEEPQIDAAFCRFVFMNEDDHWTWISDLEMTRAGILPEWIERIAVTSRIQTPSIVVQRRVYEELGGYDSRMYHCSDWDMWKRIAAHCSVWYEPTVLACYRMHSKSDTSTLMRTGRNIEDMRRSITIARDYLPIAVAERLTYQAYRQCARHALVVARAMLQRQEFSGALAQIREALKTSCSVDTFVHLALMMLRSGIDYMMLRSGIEYSRGSFRRFGRRATSN